MSDLNATLFGFTAKTDIEMAIRDVTKTPRTVYDYKIVLDGRTFDAEDMLETLGAVRDGNAYITDHAMVGALKKLGVIVSGGSRDISARAGENFDLFLKLLREQVRSMGSTM
jgi:hypothetical protein